jgi:hypothetical protein
VIIETRGDKMGSLKGKAAIILLLVVFMLPGAFATSVGTGIGVDIITEDFPPLVWLCDSRVMYDDNVQWGRACGPGGCLIERNNNYAFEGEQIAWKVLVMDKNGNEKVEDVFATIGELQGIGNDIEVNCNRAGGSSSTIDVECNARILEEELVIFDPEVMDYYDCILTVETPVSMYGEYWVTVEAVDLDGLSGTMDENEYWFFNPFIELYVNGLLEFTDVRPGTAAYANTILVGNDADDGSGVLLDMFIAGTDFYDSASSGAMCPTTNQLDLSAFNYYVVNGAYSSATDLMHDNGAFGTGIYDPAVTRGRDAEGYVNIQHGDHWDKTMYNEAEILQANPINGGALGYAANILAPGAEMALTFRLMLPEPCNGDFDTGSIYFYGEAV